MPKYYFKWKVEDGFGCTIKGEETISIDQEITLQELEEEISKQSQIGNDLFGFTCILLSQINFCDCDCENWKVYGLKKQEDKTEVKKPTICRKEGTDASGN